VFDASHRIDALADATRHTANTTERSPAYRLAPARHNPIPTGPRRAAGWLVYCPVWPGTTCRAGPIKQFQINLRSAIALGKESLSRIRSPDSLAHGPIGQRTGVRSTTEIENESVSSGASTVSPSTISTFGLGCFQRRRLGSSLAQRFRSLRCTGRCGSLVSEGFCHCGPGSNSSHVGAHASKRGFNRLTAWPW